MGRISCEWEIPKPSSLGIVFYLNIFFSMRRIVCALALLVFGFAAALDVEPIQLSASEWRKGNVASNKIACFQVLKIWDMNLLSIVSRVLTTYCDTLSADCY
jgi:hypothetical protein